MWLRLHAGAAATAAAATAATVDSGNRRWLGAAAVAAASAASLHLLRRLLADWRQRRRRRAATRAKREERQRGKAEFAAYLARQEMSDAEEAAIACLPARQLVERLRRGDLRPERVLLAYQRRAFRVDQRLNCVAEFLMPDLAEVNLAGPLAGLPVSLKENFSLKGLDSCVGCAAFVGQPVEADCSPVRQLKALGGVPFVRTIVPQTMLTVLSSNPIDGTALNPADPRRSPGGSSSGEGALVAAGGSPLGLGSDIGGSIRTPAAWCGAAGLKPTSGRLSRLGMRSTGPQRLVEPSWGPMAPDVDSLALYMEAALNGGSNDDPTVPPIGFDVDEAAVATTAGDWAKRPMTIGYFVSHGQLRAVPCMERAVLLARDRLAARGHRLVPWSPPTPADEFPIVETYARCVWSDAGRHMRSLLRHDTASVSIANFAPVLGLPIWLRRLLARALLLLGDADSALGIRCLSGVDSVYELWQLGQLLQDRRTEFLASWQRAGLDALLCPANATPAPPIDDQRVTLHCLSYNVLFNLLNLPAGVLPVTKVTRADVDALRGDGGPGGGWEPSLVAMQAGTINLPVAVQCVALPWREETCLRLMREVEAAVGKAE